MDRRNFISTTLSGIGAMASIQSIAQENPVHFATMQRPSVKILATDWGFQGDIDTFCALVKKEGYDGIEMWWPGNVEKRKLLFAALEKHELEVGYLCGSHEANYKTHLDAFRANIKQATTEFVRKPLYINCHSGKDFYSSAQNQAMLDITADAASKSGLLICHETHRGRMLFAAHIARGFIEKNPSLRLTLDISHWCNVHESLLKDQQETVKMALERVGHIHARIGHEQGAQVNDPRAPEWENTVKAHLGWWDEVVERKAKNNETITFLTEFGPPNYMPTLPYTRQPLANQWDINVYMMHLLRDRYIKK
jgi:sugar phosphate isomerase/epimerase